MKISTAPAVPNTMRPIELPPMASASTGAAVVQTIRAALMPT